MIEVVIASAIFSIGILGFLNSFNYIARAVHTTRGRTVAANLLQAQVEALKNNSYYALQVTTVTTTNSNYSPALVYSAGAYGPQTISIAGISFIVAAKVEFAALISGAITTLSYTDPDPGLKKISVYVMWRDGPNWKKMTLSNLLENPNVTPQTATITGTVRESGPNTAIAGATVRTLENISLQGASNASGVYSFKVNAGTYTLQASSGPFYFQVSSSSVVSAGSTLTRDFTLTRVATGTVSGSVWRRPSEPFLITQAVASTFTYIPDLGSSQDVEFVELINPTTTPYSFEYMYLQWGRHNNSTDTPYKYRYAYGYPWDPDPTWDYLSFRSTYIPANTHYLIANTSMSFTLFDSTVTPDAWYDFYADWDGSIWTFGVPGPFLNGLKTSDETSGPCDVYLFTYDPAWGTYRYDSLGWQGSNRKAPVYYKTDYPRCRGVTQGEQVVRFSSPAWTSDEYQRAYDTENNRRDFHCPLDTLTTPMTRRALSVQGGSKTAISGVPAYGALVSVNDLYSNSTAAYQVTVSTASGGVTYPSAKYFLQGVSTGTWTVSVASSSYYTEITSVTITTSNEVVTIPSSSTVEAWVTTGAYHTLLTSTGSHGYVSGFIRDVSGVALNGIQIVAGGIPKTTNAQGFYSAAVATGPVTVIVNPNNANSAYVSDTFNVTVEQGIVTNVSDNLLRGGTLRGYVTSGVSALPNISVIALLGGVQMGDGTSDSSGYFFIYNLSTGTFTVQPALDPVADATPDTFSSSVTQGLTTFVGTFTVTGAYGTLTGSVKKAGSNITTGALIIASSVTIPAAPPTVVASSSAAQDVYYAVSSLSDGTYSLLVRGATNFNYNIRAWYPTISGDTVTTATVNYTALSVSPGASTTKNIDFP